MGGGMKMVQQSIRNSGQPEVSKQNKKPQG